MLKEILPEKDFKRSLAILFAFGLVHTIVLLCSIAMPFGAIYGPLLYLSFKSAKGESLSFSYLHIIPFLVLLFVYILTFFGVEFSISWAYGLTRFAYIEYYIIIPLSLLIYSVVLLAGVKKTIPNASQRKILFLLSTLSIGYATGLIFSGLQKTNVLSFGLKIQDFLFVFPLILAAVIVFYLFTSEEQLLQVKAPNLPRRDDLYGDKTSDEVMLALKLTLEENQLYRNSAISLEMLAEKTNIPKHHLSNFLNTYLGKSFYQLIAEYRVDYAKKRLAENNIVTIETLAYECGFNSKTSLNKYFKEVTGSAPSQYRTDANQLP